MNTSSLPLISVVTICRNSLGGLKQTIQSVLEQTFGDFEFVIIDGNSTDGTKFYLEELPRSIRWISEPDCGISDAFNKGAVFAKGEWVIYLNAGDTFIDNTILAGMSTILENCSPEIHAICGSIEYRNEKGEYLKALHSRIDKLGSECTMAHQASFIRRAFQIENKYDIRLRTSMDYDFWLRIPTISRIECVNRRISACAWGGVSTAPALILHQYVTDYFLRMLNTKSSKYTLGEIMRLALRCLNLSLKQYVKAKINFVPLESRPNSKLIAITKRLFPH